MDILIGHDDIRGPFQLNSLNHPTVVINRRSGMLTVDGMFSECSDADDGHRRF